MNLGRAIASVVLGALSVTIVWSGHPFFAGVVFFFGLMAIWDTSD